MRRLPVVFLSVFLILNIMRAAAQPEACPGVLAAALAATSESCAGLGRNQACYGSAEISAVARDADAGLEFAESGDTVALADIASLELGELAPDEPAWGVAVLALQANLPDNLPGQNAILVAFGGVALEDASSDDDSPPMQAFRLRSGIGVPACSDAPADGILIQTPAGAGEVSLEINKITVTLGSTAVVRAVDGHSLRFTILEGYATLALDEAEVVVLPFKTAVVPLDENGDPDGEITIEDSIPADYAALPLVLLPREVTLPPVDAGVTPFTTPEPVPEVLGGRWSYDTVDIDTSACAAGANTTGASGEETITLNDDGTFTLFDVRFEYEGGVWRSQTTESASGFSATNTYEITFDGETATAAQVSEITGSALGACVIRWTAAMAYLGDE